MKRTASLKHAGIQSPGQAYAWTSQRSLGQSIGQQARTHGKNPRNLIQNQTAALAVEQGGNNRLPREDGGEQCTHAQIFSRISKLIHHSNSHGVRNSNQAFIYINSS